MHNSEVTPTTNGILPGTTFPAEQNFKPKESLPSGTPSSTPGPIVNTQPTTLTLYTPGQLATSSLLPDLINVINVAFRRQGHSVNGRSVLHGTRLRYDGHLLEELGAGHGTFTYILHSQDTERTGKSTVLGTASAKRYLGRVDVAGEEKKREVGNTFTRFGLVDEGKEVWELSIMAVYPGLQKQGIAGFLMRVTEAEVVWRFKLEHGEKAEKKLIMVITTIKEVNEPFYMKRQYVTDYEVAFPVGHMDSETGFTITHMSKQIAVDA